jgi:DNA adenine methylase
LPADTERLIEPFCGAGAVSIAAAAHGLADRFVLNDLNKPLADLWVEILQHPAALCDEYENHWYRQQHDTKSYFFKIRDEFNKTHQPQQLLYLLARIVKGSVRYSSDGNFNQSPDNRRFGMKPHAMRGNIQSVSTLLKSRTDISALDFRDVVEMATASDLVYMDPPYQGTSFTRDHRYLNGLSYDDFANTLVDMNERQISYIVSYDGATGGKAHGKLLPSDLGLQYLEINAGRSSQATLLGRTAETVESLYLSPALVARLNHRGPAVANLCTAQVELALA